MIVRTISLFILLFTINQEVQADQIDQIDQSNDISVVQSVTTSYQQPEQSGIIDENQLTCLAKAIYYESASEPDAGKLAVAQVVLNRASADGFPKDYCAVVYQRTRINKTMICQFSWVCDRHLHKRVDLLWETCLTMAHTVMMQNLANDQLAQLNVLYFHEAHINPHWTGVKFIKRIGNHLFYAKRKQTTTKKSNTSS